MFYATVELYADISPVTSVLFVTVTITITVGNPVQLGR